MATPENSIPHVATALASIDTGFGDLKVALLKHDATNRNSALAPVWAQLQEEYKTRLFKSQTVAVDGKLLAEVFYDMIVPLSNDEHIILGNVLPEIDEFSTSLATKELGYARCSSNEHREKLLSFAGKLGDDPSLKVAKDGIADLCVQLDVLNKFWASIQADMGSVLESLKILKNSTSKTDLVTRMRHTTELYKKPRTAFNAYVQTSMRW